MTDPSPSQERPELLGASFVRALLDQRGVPRHRQAKQVAELLNLGYTQAHRRLTGAAAWPVDDLARLAEHLGTTLSELVAGGNASGARETASSASGNFAQARWTVDGQQLLCEVWIGDVVQGDFPGSLVARRIRTAHASNDAAEVSRPQWEVFTRSGARSSPSLKDSTWHTVSRLCIVPEQHQNYRVAILDDDADVADTLAEQFRRAGFEAHAFYSANDLIKALSVQPFDAYVLDWILADGTARSLVEAIRTRDPHCPIVMLTGQLLSKRADEAEVADAMQAWRLMFYEKPVRGLIVATALKQALARISNAGEHRPFRTD